MATYNAEMAKKTDSNAVRARRAANIAAPTRTSRNSSAARPLGSGKDAPYHHGALRDALLEAAERVLEREGLPGLTLRAVVREDVRQLGQQLHAETEGNPLFAVETIRSLLELE